MSEKRIGRSEQFVAPGDKLGVIEEFLPGQGTYVDDGVIYSQTTGHTLMDRLNKTISVYSKVRLPLVPKESSIVLGQIANVQEKSVDVRILKIDQRWIPRFFSGLLHVSNVSEGYVRAMFDAFKVGDIIRAKVISTANRASHLSTEDGRFGVVHALCPRCGHLLISGGGGLLRCPSCKGTERRKVASDYGASFDREAERKSLSI